MPPLPRYPSLYQINTRVWLTEVARRLGPASAAATLDDIPDQELDRLKDMGLDWVWFLSVWQTSPASRQISLTNPEWRREFQETLPDLQDADIVGSGFAIQAYSVAPSLGGNAALARLRQRLHQRGLRLLLDFVPNHMGLDHPWVAQHADYFVAGSELECARAPQNYCWVKRPQGDLLLAHGRDPYFPGWPDTLQLNYGNPALQEAMIGELLNIAGMCDGVRCDMAMLILPDVFERTWGLRAAPFWPGATERVRAQHPDFTFMGEVYWDLEWVLQQQGFDYTYDKRLYDRLRAGHARPVREHLCAGLDFQDKLARFLENHDEPRAAATLDEPVHRAAAVLTFLTPGLRFFHQGQFEGRKKRISPHLIRGPVEPIEEGVQHFYDRLLDVLRRAPVKTGAWQLLECAPAWPGNWTSACFIAFAWEGPNQERLVVAVNFAPNQSQCNIRLPFTDLRGHTWRMHDLLSSASFDWQGDPLTTSGLFVDLAPWGCHVFEMTESS